MAYIRLGSVVLIFDQFKKLVLSSLLFLKHLWRLPVLILLISLFSTNFALSNNQEVAQGIVQILSQIGGQVDGAPQCGAFDREKMRKHKADARKARDHHLNQPGQAGNNYQKVQKQYEAQRRSNANVDRTALNSAREAYYAAKRKLRYQYYCESVVEEASPENLNNLEQAIDNVTEYAKYNVCSCCENPARCLFSTPGQVMNALTQMAPLGTAIGLGVGAKSGSDICKDVGNVQKLLGVMNGMASINCAGKNATCMDRYHACVAKIGKIEIEMQEAAEAAELKKQSATRKAQEVLSKANIAEKAAEVARNKAEEAAKELKRANTTALAQVAKAAEVAAQQAVIDVKVESNVMSATRDADDAILEAKKVAQPATAEAIREAEKALRKAYAQEQRAKKAVLVATEAVKRAQQQANVVVEKKAKAMGAVAIGKSSIATTAMKVAQSATELVVRETKLVAEAVQTVAQAVREAKEAAKEAAQLAAEAAQRPNWQGTLDKYREQLEDNVRPSCKFAKKASGHMALATAALFGQAMLSKVCSKGLEGGEDEGGGEEVASTAHCFDPSDEKYNSDECYCLRAPYSNACLCTRDENKDLAVCKEAGPGGSSENPEGSNNPTGSSNPGNSEGKFDGFSKSDNGQTDANSIFGDPDVTLSSGDGGSDGSAGSPQYSRGSPGGGAGGLGGLGGAAGGGGSEEEEPVAEDGGEGDDEGADYSNLMQGLTGKSSGGSGSYGGGDYNFDRPSDDDDGFDLSKFLPKGDKDRDVAGAGNDKNAVSSRDESIFEVSSKVTRVYCQNNQVECASEQKK